MSTTTKRASKDEAARMISRAKRNGWKVEVDTLRSNSERPWCVQVTLSRRFDKGMLFTWANVFVAFRAGSKYSRASVAVSSQCDWQTERCKGIWSAKHAIQYMNDTVARHS